MDSACGAAIGAYNLIHGCATPTNKGTYTFDEDFLLENDDPYDGQFHYIKSALKDRYPTIAKSANPQARLAKEMHYIIRDYLLQICYDLPRGKLIMCGGIEINMD